MIKIIYNTNLVKKLTLGFVKKSGGVTILPFIFLTEDKRNDDRILNHEMIHIEQQKEMLFIFFTVWYYFEWIIRCIQYKNCRIAYRNISFEREAKRNERNPYYLQKRKRFNFLKYVSTNYFVNGGDVC